MRKDGSKQTHKTEKKCDAHCEGDKMWCRIKGDKKILGKICKFLTTQSCVSHFFSKTLCLQHNWRPNMHMGPQIILNATDLFNMCCTDNPKGDAQVVFADRQNQYYINVADSVKPVEALGGCVSSGNLLRVTAFGMVPVSANFTQALRDWHGMLHEQKTLSFAVRFFPPSVITLVYFISCSFNSFSHTFFHFSVFLHIHILTSLLQPLSALSPSSYSALFVTLVISSLLNLIPE